MEPLIVEPEFKPENSEKEEENALLKKIIQDKDNQISLMSLSMLTKDTQIASQQKRIRISRKKTNQMSKDLKKKELQIESQQTQIEKMKSEQTSTSLTNLDEMSYDELALLNKSNCVIEKM